MNISDLLERGNPEDLDEAVDGRSTPGDENGAQNGPINVSTPASGTSKSLNSRNYMIIAIIVLSATASLGLGILAGQGSGSAGGLVVSSVPMTHPSTATLSASALDAATMNSTSSALSSIPSGGEVIGSRSAHIYYLPWCTQVAQISKSDEVWFSTEQDAKTAGFTPGPGCKGI